MEKNFKLKNKIIKNIRHGDHIGYMGFCHGCGAKRYLFQEEMKKFEWDIFDGLGKEVACRNMLCHNPVEMRFRLSDFHAVHLNNIRRRGA